MAKRFTIPFFRIESPAFFTDRGTLADYRMPISKIIESQTIRDMHDMEDSLFYATAALAAQEDIRFVEPQDTFTF